MSCAFAGWCCQRDYTIHKFKAKGEWSLVEVFVVGANGQIGRHLIRLLSKSKEHSVRAMKERRNNRVS
ncbi:NAD-dependent epimerase/dehydratase family protein [Aneurinibacillus terranovensis]|uniref:NAD-dependent epimerase/dehydratase family protein n=1 Tax=Aneurinibacillus terranovensis TaxID=278991 RepID=UPI003CCBAA06